MDKATKILICGATGFIGRNITEIFSRSYGFDIHAVYHKRRPYKNPKITWHYADLRNPEQVLKLLKNFEIVIQCAATTSGANDIVNKPYIHVTDNAVMNSYLLQAAYQNKIKHFIFFSCTVIYSSSDKLVKEEDFTDSENIFPKYYGVGNTKIYLEKMCKFFSGISKTKFTVIRHSNIYGPYDKYDLKHSHVFGATITKVMQAKKNIEVWGTGQEKRDFLHIEDLVSFVQNAIQKQNEPYLLLNCGSGRLVSIKELVEKVIHISGKNLDIVYNLEKPTIETSLALDCSQANNKLGWKPKISLEYGIRDTLDWWSSNYAKE